MDADPPKLAVSGELGSGKSSVSALVAEELGARRVSTGEAQRQIAAARRITTLELNRLSETDPSIDDEIDSVFRSLARTPGALVVDSRLAWHFLPNAFKVHLVVDPEVGAGRALQRTDSSAERYGTLDQALADVAERAASERRRFQRVYGVDIWDLRNYDLVVDTTTAAPAEVAAAVLRTVAGRTAGAGRPVLLLAPGRLAGLDAGRDEGPSHDVVLEAELRAKGYAAMDPVAVAYDRPRFAVVEGHRRVAAALAAGLPLLAAELVEAS